MTPTARTNLWPWPEHTTRLKVGDLRIDLPHRRVERPDGVRQELPQRVFDLLLVFLAEPDTVHSRDALFERVWHGVIVEDANLTQGVWMLRKAFGEERRHWFRTVAKTGYAFEPPGPVLVEEDAVAPPQPADELEPAPTGDAPPAPAPAGTDTATGTGFPAAPSTGTGADIATDMPAAPPIARATRAPWRALAGIAATLVALVALILPVLSPRTPSQPAPGQDDIAAAATPATPPPARKVVPPLRIHLSPDAPAGSTQAQDGTWAALLADAWLGFKLEMLPDTLLMTRGSVIGKPLAADERRITIRALLDPAQPGQLRLQARIADASGNAAPPLEVQGPAEDATQLADALTRKVLAHLLPARADEAWPALPRDAVAARHYALAVQASRRRDWASAEREADIAVKTAPDFGPLRWLLALLHMRRGDLFGAIELSSEARRSSTPLPADAERYLDTLVKSIDPTRHKDTLDAFTALAADWPGRIDYSIQRAMMLSRLGHTSEATVALTHPPESLRTMPVEVRIRQAIASSEAALIMGDPEASRRHAQAALALASAPGMDRERAIARLLIARAHHAVPGNALVPELFERAAESFLATGDKPNALYARFLGDNLPQDARTEASVHLEPLIEAARKLRITSLEVEVLRTTAYRFHAAGDHARFRHYLRRAQEAANSSDDLHSQRVLDVDLMGEDFFMANATSARARIRRLRAGGLDGAIGYLVPLFDSTMTMHEGHYRKALELLRDGDAPGKERPPSVVEANYACVRADILLAQGDTIAARRQADRCRDLGPPPLQAVARMLDIQTDLSEGDRESAYTKLQVIERDLASLSRGVERWLLTGGIGYAFAASGDYDRAEHWLHREIDATRDAGYLLVYADIETSLAEIAAARGDWPRSRSLVLSARRHLPQELWLPGMRLDRLDIVDALVHGDATTARARMAALHARAKALDDRMTLRDLQVLATIAPPPAQEPTSPEAMAPLDPAQVYIDWIYGRLPEQHATHSASR